MDFCTFTLCTDPFQMKVVSGQFLLLPCFIEMLVINASRIDPD